MIDAAKLRQLIAQTMLLCEESATSQKDASVSASLTEARQTLASLHKRVQSAETRYSVGVVGLTNVGKSTLLNALFGQELAPRRNGPCTAAPIEFVYGESLTVTSHHFNSIQRPTWNCADIEDVHARLSALADSAGAEQSRIIRKVVVTAPLDLLANGLIVCDTPGFGAAQLADAAGSHDEAVKQYLKTDLSQVFWVVLGEQGIGKREKDFHAAFFGEICDDIIVTGCEDWEDRDKTRFRKRFSALFCQRMPHFHFVSGLLGHKARLNNDSSQLEEAGIPDLERRIKSLANPDGRNQSIIVAYQQLARDVMNWFDEYRLEGHEATLWRSDSWIRFTSFVAAADCGQLAGRFFANESQSLLSARDANGWPKPQPDASQSKTIVPPAPPEISRIPVSSAHDANGWPKAQPNAPQPEITVPPVPPEMSRISVMSAHDASGWPEAQPGVPQPKTIVPTVPETLGTSVAQSSIKPDIKPLPTVKSSLQQKAKVLRNEKLRKRMVKRTLFFGVAGVVILNLLLLVAVIIFPPSGFLGGVDHYLFYLLSLLPLGLILGWRLERLMQRCGFMLLRSLGVGVGFLIICDLFKSFDIVVHLSVTMVVYSISFMLGVIFSALIAKLQKRKAKSSHD